MTHQIRNVKNMKVPPSVQEVMVCWGLTQRESDKIKMSLHHALSQVFHQNQNATTSNQMFYLFDRLRGPQAMNQQCSDFLTKNTLIEMFVTYWFFD